MLNFWVVVDAVIYSMCFVAAVFLYSRFKRTSSSRLYAFAAAWALILGLLIGLAGLGHTLAVTATHVSSRSPYDFRFAWLLVTGLLLIFSGAANVIVSRSIGRGSRWALWVSASATVLLLGFVAALYPLRRDIDLVVIYGSFLGLLVVALVHGARHRRV